MTYSASFLYFFSLTI